MSHSIHPLDKLYAHSPPTIELEPPSKKHKIPTTSTSMPFIDSSLIPAQPVAIPRQPPTDPSPTTLLQSCPPPLTYSSSSSSHYSVMAPLYSLPEFKVGSLPHQPPPVWPLKMINEFLTPPSNRSFSFSEPSSSSEEDDTNNDHPLVFDMDDIK